MRATTSAGNKGNSSHNAVEGAVAREQVTAFENRSKSSSYSSSSPSVLINTDDREQEYSLNLLREVERNLLQARNASELWQGKGGSSSSSGGGVSDAAAGQRNGGLELEGNQNKDLYNSGNRGKNSGSKEQLEVEEVDRKKLQQEIDARLGFSLIDMNTQIAKHARDASKGELEGEEEQGMEMTDYIDSNISPRNPRPGSSGIDMFAQTYDPRFTDRPFSGNGTVHGSNSANSIGANSVPSPMSMSQSQRHEYVGETGEGYADMDEMDDFPSDSVRVRSQQQDGQDGQINGGYSPKTDGASNSASNSNSDSDSGVFRGMERRSSEPLVINKSPLKEMIKAQHQKLALQSQPRVPLPLDLELNVNTHTHTLTTQTGVGGDHNAVSTNTNTSISKGPGSAGSRGGGRKFRTPGSGGGASMEYSDLEKAILGSQ